jgi:opacity protein-like surface antigen
MVIGFLIILGCSTATAQSKKYEVSGFLGYTVSEGVDVRPVEFDDDRIIDRLNPTSGVSFGFGLNYFRTEKISFGFNYSRQSDELEGRMREQGNIDFTEMNVCNFHGTVTYYWGFEGDEIRPYMLGGIGFTHYGPDPIGELSVDDSTRLSTTWGGGVAIQRTDRIGFRIQGRWTPTRIKTGSDGMLCSRSWQWNCWVVEDANHSHQFELSAGVFVRF